jgi:hypothetical protein
MPVTADRWPFYPRKVQTRAIKPRKLNLGRIISKMSIAGCYKRVKQFVAIPPRIPFTGTSLARRCRSSVRIMHRPRPVAVLAESVGQVANLPESRQVGNLSHELPWDGALLRLFRDGVKLRPTLARKAGYSPMQYKSLPPRMYIRLPQKVGVPPEPLGSAFAATTVGFSPGSSSRDSPASLPTKMCLPARQMLG